jgi:hypothetical protein
LFDIGTSGTVANANAPIEASDLQPQDDGPGLATSTSFRSCEPFTVSALTYGQTPSFPLSQASPLTQSGNGFSQSGNTSNGFENMPQPVNLRISDSSSYLYGSTATPDSHYALGVQGIDGQEQGSKHYFCDMAHMVNFGFDWCFTSSAI